MQSILEDGLKLRTVILPDRSRPRGCKPTIVIIDESFEDQPWLAAPLKHMLLHMPGVAVVVLARAVGSVAIDKALAAGARAVLPETAQVTEIRACIRAVLGGRIWTPREGDGEGEAASIVERPAKATLAERFTPKEREVMQWLAQGRSNREIAVTMRIDEATVKAHLGRMLRKAQASNRVELTLRALGESQVESQSGTQRGIQRGM